MTSDTDSNFRGLYAGAVAGIASRMVTAPIDLLKIRTQLETASHPCLKTYPSMLHSIRTIYKHEGFNAFWKGNTAGIWLYGSFSAVQFWTYSHLSASLGPGSAGGLAAMSATLFTYPFDLIRTRMALQNKHPEIYGTLRGTIRHIWAFEGPKGFYKGVAPSLLQVMPYMGLSFYFHAAAKKAADRFTAHRGSVDFFAGGLAGIFSKTIMMPVDVIRKRLQIQGSPYKVYALSNLPVYSGAVDCIRTIWVKEGFLGFYRGLTLAVLKSGPATATTFLVYGIVSRI